MIPGYRVAFAGNKRLEQALTSQHGEGGWSADSIYRSLLEKEILA